MTSSEPENSLKLYMLAGELATKAGMSEAKFTIEPFGEEVNARTNVFTNSITFSGKILAEEVPSKVFEGMVAHELGHLHDDGRFAYKFFQGAIMALWALMFGFAGFLLNLVVPADPDTFWVSAGLFFGALIGSRKIYHTGEYRADAYAARLLADYDMLIEAIEWREKHAPRGQGLMRLSGWYTHPSSKARIKKLRTR